MSIRLWNKGELTSTYLALEVVVHNEGVLQKDLIRKEYWQADSNSIHSLLDQRLIRRSKTIDGYYRLYPTTEGVKEYNRLKRQWTKDVKPTLETVEIPKEKRESIFREIDALDNVIHILEATANTYYSPNDDMWNVLLKARDRISTPIEEKKRKLYKEVEIIDKGR